MERRPVKLNLRMDATLRQRLSDEAERSIRSINGEIIHRLLESLKDRPPARRIDGNARKLEHEH